MGHSETNFTLLAYRNTPHDSTGKKICLVLIATHPLKQHYFPLHPARKFIILLIIDKSS